MGRNAKRRKEQKIIEKYGTLPKERQPMPWNKIGLILIALLVIGFGGYFGAKKVRRASNTNSGSSPTPSISPSPSPTSSPTDQSTTQPSDQAKNQSNNQTNQEDAQTMYTTIETNLGSVKIELFKKDAPKTVENFKKLAEKGYYNGVTFHRVIKDFMIQGGDPTGTGAGGDSAFGGSFEDEINNHKIVAGTLAMANRGPNTNGSQFFIVTQSPQPHLDGKHTVFGQVAEGMEIVKKIAAVPVDANDKPIEPVKIVKVSFSDK